MFLLTLITGLAAALLGACTTHVRVPRSAAACAAACDATLASCLADCEPSRGNPQVVENVRIHLCDQRCQQTHEQCVYACPGVR
jgi:hypothetical protein